MIFFHSTYHKLIMDKTNVFQIYLLMSFFSWNVYALEVSKDHNDSMVVINFLTPHSELIENRDLELKCSVSIMDENFSVGIDWVFQPDEINPKLQRLVTNSSIVNENNYTRVSVTTRRSWDFVSDCDVEEHYLKITNLQLNDQGIYACQVKSMESQKIVASKHSFITVVPRHNVITSSLDTYSTNTNQKNSQEPTLGPITERYVYTTRGKDVVLECRNADGNWVYWKKHGDPSVKGTGRKLRLFRVDGWDSGHYYCYTNSTKFKSKYNVTLLVEHEPIVKGVLYDGQKTAKQALGYSAILKCNVEGVPVPQIMWYQVLEDTNSSQEGHSIVYKRHRIHSGPEFSISISTYKDGFVASQLKIAHVKDHHYGTFVCVAKNHKGKGELEIHLKESRTPLDFNAIINEKQNPLLTIQSNSNSASNFLEKSIINILPISLLFILCILL